MSLTARELLEGYDKEEQEALVNEREQTTASSLIDQYYREDTGRKTSEQLASEREIEALNAKLPSWFGGEFTSGFGRGVDQMQQTGYAVGALGSDLVGLDKARDWFLTGMKQQDAEIAENPTEHSSYESVDGFDSFMRYVSSSIGELAPNILESIGTGIAGAAIGSSAAPGPGTGAGAITGFIGRQAARNIIKEGAEELVKKELKDYATGKIKQEAISEGTKALLKAESRKIAGKYGATTALAMSAWTQASGGIYSDLQKDPNLSEPDRKIAAIVGGLASAIPETFMEGYIVRKFFPGSKEVTSEMAGQASSYLIRFVKEYGKEFLKVAPGEGFTEVVQTMTEEAAKNWADPNKRENIFNYTPEQRTAFVDSFFKGTIGGTAIAGISSARTAMAPHTNPEVRKNEDEILSKADDQTSSEALQAIGGIQVTPEDERLSQIANRRDQIGEMMEQASEEDAKTLAQELDALDKEEEALLGGEPLVNENQEESLADKVLAMFGNEESVNVSKVQKAFGKGYVESEEALNELGARGLLETGNGNAPRKFIRSQTTVSTPDTRTTPEDLSRALYAQIMPSRKVYKQSIPDIDEKVAAKKAEVDSLVNEIKAQDPEYAAQLAKSFDDNALSMLAAEGVKVRIATDADAKRGAPGFATFDEDGDIVLTVPSTKRFLDEGAGMDLAVPTGLGAAAGQKDYAKLIPEVVGHELIHVADLVGIRNDYRKTSQKVPFSKYEERVTRERGESLIRAFPSLPAAARKVYSPLVKQNLTARQIGQELPRMAVQLARQGRLNEATDALARSAREDKGGKVTRFLKNWIDAIRNLNDTIVKMLAKDGNKDLKKVVDQINKVLDKYGVLVNERDRAKNTPVKKEVKKESQPVVLPAIESPVAAKEPEIVQPSDFKPKPVKRRKQTKRKNEKKRTKPDTNQGQKDGQVDATETKPDNSEGVGSNEGLGETAVQPQPRGRSEAARRVVEIIRSQDGSLTGRISRAQQLIAKEHPEALPIFNKVAQQAMAAAENIPGAAGYLRGRIDAILPAKGEAVAMSLVNERHDLYAQTKPDLVNQTANWLIENSLGMRILPEDGEVQNTVLDLWGDFYGGTGAINTEASVAAPATIVDKLTEAKATSGIPDTRSFAELGLNEISMQSLAALDQQFGENGWIVKTFIGDNAVQGKGVYTATFLKKIVSENPELFEGRTTNSLMVQRMYDLPDTEGLAEAYSKSSPIFYGNEVRVHAITDPATGDVTIVPFATFRKGERVELPDRVPVIFNDADIETAERAAKAALDALPVQERLGSMFGVDVIRTRDGWGVVELNPTVPGSAATLDEGGGSGYISDNIYAQDAFVSAMLGKPPLAAEMADALMNPLVNEKSPAQSQRPTEAEAIAQELGSSFDGDMGGMAYLFTDRQGSPATNPSFGATYAVRPPLTFDKVQKKLAETRAKFAAAPTNTYQSGPRVVSTAIKVGDKILRGQQWNSPHASFTTEAVMEALENSGDPEDFERGFVVTDEQGNERFASRAEAGPIAQAAGQARDRADLANFQSQDLIDPTAPAQASRLTENQIKLIEQESRRANRRFVNEMSGLQETPQRDRERAGEIPLEGASPMELFYLTQPHTVSTNYAAAFVSDAGGAVAVAQALLNDTTGVTIGVQSMSDPDLPGLPNASLAAVYENVETQLSSIQMDSDRKLSVAGRAWVRDLMYRIHQVRREMLTSAGQFISYTGRLHKLYTGFTALRDYVDDVLRNAEGIVGKNANEKMGRLAAELNGLWDKYGQNVVNSAKMISIIRKMHTLVNESRFQKGVKAGMRDSLEKLASMSRKAAARAARHIANEEGGEEYANKAAQNIVKEMTGMPKDINSVDEKVLFSRIVSKMTREIGKNMGLISDNPKVDKLTEGEKFAIILKNYDLYAQFTRNVHDAYIAEYGGQNPSQRVLDEAAQLFASLSNRMWSEGMVTSLVNEKTRELEISIAKVVRQSYRKGDFEVKKIREGIRETMMEQGVENDGLIDQLVSDVTAEIEARLARARIKFFTSERGIRSFLAKMKKDLASLAKEHATTVESMRNSFEEFLVEEYDFPNQRELPLAKIFADAMQGELNKLVEGERAKIINRWAEEVKAEIKDPEKKRKLDKSVIKILELANMGALKKEDIYNKIAERFNLPKYEENLAREVERLGDIIGNASTDRQRAIASQELSNLMSQHKGFTTGEAYQSWMYFSMLSGLSTPIVNIGGNLTMLMDYTAIEAIKHPQRIPRMIRALFSAMTGVAQTETREAFFTGMALGKQGEKYFKGQNVFEVEDAYFKSEIFGDPRLQKADVALAKFVHRIARGIPIPGTKERLGAKWVSRVLTATDVFFYNLAKEMAFASRSDFVHDPTAWQSAQKKARQEMILAGQDPDASPEMRRRRDVLAYSILQDLRLRDKNGVLVNERVDAWNEANAEALDASYTNEPRGLLGDLAKYVERFSADYPIAKMVVPFTRIAANVTNHMLDWTPIGVGRYMLESAKQGFNPLMMRENGKWRKESDHAIRAMLGAAAYITLMGLLADEDEDDPYFTIYGGGPRDLNTRRQWMQRGWKPHSVKVGDKYYSYIYWPISMMLSVVGRQMDEYREGHITAPNELTASSISVAILDSVVNQSFLASISDFMGAVDGYDPEVKLGRIAARFATIPIPNAIKQLDKFLDPSIQDPARGFREAIIKELPVFRHSLLPALNVFGEEVSRTKGIFPGSERFVSFEVTDDPVVNMLGEKGIVVPGYSKGTRLGNERMTPEQFHEYVKTSGQIVKRRIQAELPSLRRMSHDAAEERVKKISEAAKAEVRSMMRKKYAKKDSR